MPKSAARCRRTAAWRLCTPVGALFATRWIECIEWRLTHILERGRTTARPRGARARSSAHAITSTTGAATMVSTTAGPQGDQAAHHDVVPTDDETRQGVRYPGHAGERSSAPDSAPPRNKIPDEPQLRAAVAFSDSRSRGQASAHRPARRAHSPRAVPSRDAAHGRRLPPPAGGKGKLRALTACKAGRQLGPHWRPRPAQSHGAPVPRARQRAGPSNRSLRDLSART